MNRGERRGATTAEHPLARHADLLEAEGNESLRRACLLAAPLGLVSGPFMLLADRLGLAEGWAIPGLWSLLCGLAALAGWRAASAGMIRGRGRALFTALFVSLPALLYLLAHAALPAGAATYITGPPSYLYFFLIVLTGLLFSPALSLLAGLLAAAQYLAFYALARPGLALLASADPLLLQDITHPALYFFKALMMALTGALLALVGAKTGTLLERMLAHEHARERVDRLFGQYVPGGAKELLLADSGVSSGRRREAVILFCDLRGFTAWSEGRDPAEIVAGLNEYFARMVDAAVRHGGTVDKFIGDAIMVVFGGIVELPDPDGAAVDAARAMRAELSFLNKIRAARGEPALAHGIGIHRGAVIVGPIGGETRRDYTAIGDPVNGAARVEALTREKGRAILVTGEVAARLPARLAALLEPLGKAGVKGKSEPLELFGIPDAPPA